MNDQPKNGSDNGNGNKKPHPVLSLQISVMSNGSVAVSSFPSNLLTSMDLLANAQKIILMHFAKLAKEGELDENLSIITSPIITADKKLVDSSGMPII